MGACLSGANGGLPCTNVHAAGNGKVRNTHLLAQAIAQDDYSPKSQQGTAQPPAATPCAPCAPGKAPPPSPPSLMGVSTGVASDMGCEVGLGLDSTGAAAGASGPLSSSEGMSTLSSNPCASLANSSGGNALYTFGSAASSSCNTLYTYGSEPSSKGNELYLKGSDPTSCGTKASPSSSSSGCCHNNSAASVVIPLVTAHPWLLEAALKLPGPSPSSSGCGTPQAAQGLLPSAHSCPTYPTTTAATASATSSQLPSGPGRASSMGRPGRYGPHPSAPHPHQRGTNSGSRGSGGSGARQGEVETGLTPYHLAVALGSHRALQRLLQLCNGHGRSTDEVCVRARRALNAPRPVDGATPLMAACEKGDVRAVRLLLDAGADPWARQEPYRRTCLHYAAANGHAAAIRVVLEHAQAIVSSKVALAVYPASRSPAARSGRPLADLASCGGLTPLMAAAATGHETAAEELLSMGADPFLCCWDHNTDPLCCAPHGSTALHLAAAAGALPTAAAILRVCDSKPPMKYDCGSTGCVPHTDIRGTLNGMGQTALQVVESAWHARTQASATSATAKPDGSPNASRTSAADAASVGHCAGDVARVSATATAGVAPEEGARSPSFDLAAWAAVLAPKAGAKAGSVPSAPPALAHAHSFPSSISSAAAVAAAALPAGVTSAAIRTARLKAMTQQQQAGNTCSPSSNAPFPSRPPCSSSPASPHGASNTFTALSRACAGLTAAELRRLLQLPAAQGLSTSEVQQLLLLASAQGLSPSDLRQLLQLPAAQGLSNADVQRLLLLGPAKGLNPAELQRLLVTAPTHNQALGPGWKPPHSVPPTSVHRASGRPRRVALPSVPTVFERRSQEGGEEEEEGTRSCAAYARTSPCTPLSPQGVPPTPAATPLSLTPSTSLTREASNPHDVNGPGVNSLGVNSVSMTSISLTPAASIEAVEALHSAASAASEASAWLPLPPGEEEEEVVGEAVEGLSGSLSSSGVVDTSSSGSECGSPCMPRTPRSVGGKCGKPATARQGHSGNHCKAGCSAEFLA